MSKKIETPEVTINQVGVSHGKCDIQFEIQGLDATPIIDAIAAALDVAIKKENIDAGDASGLEIVIDVTPRRARARVTGAARFVRLATTVR